MGKTARYTKDQIKQVILKMITEGNAKPSVIAVRDRLGSGSASTINPILREVLTEIAEAERQVDILPEPLKEMILKSIAPIWSYAENLSLTKVVVLEEKAQQNVEALLTENGELLAQMDQQALDLENSNAEINNLKAQLSVSLEDRAALQDQAHSLEKEKLTIEIQYGESQKLLSALREEVSSLKGLHQELQKELIDLAKHQASKH